MEETLKSTTSISLYSNFLLSCVHFYFRNDISVLWSTEVEYLKDVSLIIGLMNAEHFLKRTHESPFSVRLVGHCLEDLNHWRALE